MEYNYMKHCHSHTISDLTTIQIRLECFDCIRNYSPYDLILREDPGCTNCPFWRYGTYYPELSKEC